MISKSNLLINFITVGFWTFVSRIFGFVRDIMFAAFLGSGPIGEAFIIAFSLPNIFRRFFAEGAFNAAFIPMFKKSMGNKKQSIKFTNNTTSVILIVLSLFKSAQVVLLPLGIPQLSIQLELSPSHTPQLSFTKPLFGIPSQPKSDSL